MRKLKENTLYFEMFKSYMENKNTRIKNGKLESFLENINKDELKTYLEGIEEIRESGSTNMFGATPFIVKKFFISKKEADFLLDFWMDNYDDLFETN